LAGRAGLVADQADCSVAGAHCASIVLAPSHHGTVTQGMWVAEVRVERRKTVIENDDTDGACPRNAFDCVERVARLRRV
jgi:hypothetical protein